MKTMRWLGLLILVGLGSYYYHSKNQQTVMVQERREAVSVPSLRPSSTMMPPATPSVPSTSSNFQALPVTIVAPVKHGPKYQRFAEKPKDMNVHFELIDGYAVAYGDTLLGKPMSDFHEEVGIAEMRPPKYWEHVEIPYLIKEDVVNPERIRSTLEMFNQKTSVKFVPFQNQPDAIIFVRGEKNCQSFLGRAGGVQPIFLSENCGPPEIAHELMHALGFVHEQSRMDRDQFLEILWDHIEEKYQDQYAMVPEPLMESLYDSAFDPTSIMMYESHSFAVKPGLSTMTAKNGAPLEPPLRNLSVSDIARVNRLYSKQ